MNDSSHNNNNKADCTLSSENHDETHMDEHHESHGHSHQHELRLLSRNRLWIALLINFVFMLVEIIGGLLSNSLAILADAGHMVTDVAALILSLTVAHLAEKALTPTRTYGLLRAEVLGAFVNGAVLVLIVGVIFWQAWNRVGSHVEINSPLMILIAFLGLAANLGSASVLFSSRGHSLNMKSAFLHMAADTLGSVGAIVSGVVIFLTNWTPIDTIASAVIGGLILWSSWGLLSSTINILLESTPENISYEEVKQALLNIAHVKEVNDLHIWTITSGMPSLSAHVKLYPQCSDSSHWQICLGNVRKMLREKFGIEHTTIQLEPEDFDEVSSCENNQHV